MYKSFYLIKGVNMNIYLLILKIYTTTKTMEGECKTNKIICKEKERT